MKKNVGFKTKAIHAGQSAEPVTGAVMTPIFQTSTYAQEGIGKHKGYEYARTGNPTRTALEDNLAALENGKKAYCFGSGLAATTTLFHALPANSHVVFTDNVYGGTYRLAKAIFEEKGISSDFVDTSNEEILSNSIKENTSLLFIETPTNPMLNLTDLEMVVRVAKKHGIQTLVDNTFMSPYFQNPLDFGIDIVLHSITKYINGHSDVVGGVLITTNDKMAEKFAYLQNAMGAILGPMDSFLVLRATKTLGIRMEAHQKNALAIAKAVENHSKVKRVIYPGLESHPQHELAKKQMRGFSGIVTIELESKDKAEQFATSTEIFTLAESLGGVESLICHPAGMTHAAVPLEQRLAFGLTDGILRLSVGIEETDDLVADILQALDKI